MFLTPSKSKPHPPHSTVRSDNRSIAADMWQRKKKEKKKHNQINVGNFLWFVQTAYLQKNITSFPVSIRCFCRKQYETWVTAANLIELRCRKCYCYSTVQVVWEITFNSPIKLARTSPAVSLFTHRPQKKSQRKDWMYFLLLTWQWHPFIFLRMNTSPFLLLTAITLQTFLCQSVKGKVSSVVSWQSTLLSLLLHCLIVSRLADIPYTILPCGFLWYFPKNASFVISRHHALSLWSFPLKWKAAALFLSQLLLVFSFLFFFFEQCFPFPFLSPHYWPGIFLNSLI